MTKEEEEFKKEMRNLLTTLKTESQKIMMQKEFDEWRDAVERYQKEEIERLKEKAKEEAEKSKFKISF